MKCLPELVRQRQVGFVSVGFTSFEHAAYQHLSTEVAKLSTQVRRRYATQLLGRNFFTRLTELAAQNEPLPRAYLRAIQQRRQVMLGAEARQSFVEWLVGEIGDRRAILFHETIVGAESSAAALRAAGVPALAHHSQLDAHERAEVLRQFASGEVRAVAAPRTLDEGIDAPAADIAIIVSGSRRGVS